MVHCNYFASINKMFVVFLPSTVWMEGFLSCLGGIATAVGKKILRSSSSLSQLVPNSIQTALILQLHCYSIYIPKIKVWKPTTTTKTKREMMFLFKSISSWALSNFFRWFSFFSFHININVTQEMLRQSVLDVSDERQRTVVPTENAMSEFKEERFGRTFWWLMNLMLAVQKWLCPNLFILPCFLFFLKHFTVIVTKTKWESFEAGRCGVS